MADRMAGRVAVLADVHANLPALDAVLADVDAAGADTIVLLGDIALGPMPAQTVDRLAGLGDRAIWVHGNCERELITAFDGGHVPGPNGQSATATAVLISREQRDRLDNLPLTVTLDIAGLGPTLFCHASPRRDDEMILIDSPPQRWAEILDGVAEQTVVLGHTHMHFDRLAAGRRVVNAGSVGMAYGEPGATWALLGPDVTVRTTRYDTAAAAEVISASDYPDAAGWAAEYVLQHHSDSEALEAFTQIAAEQGNAL
jgi:predicted phosphodiesterase